MVWQTLQKERAWWKVLQKAVKMRKVCEKPNGAFDNDNSYTICFSNKNLDNRQQARLERVGV